VAAGATGIGIGITVGAEDLVVAVAEVEVEVDGVEDALFPAAGCGATRNCPIP
jgi:hypothetical protein